MMYEIGQKIIINHKLERVSEGGGWRNRKWISNPIEPLEVFVIGSRVLANGFVNGDKTDGFWFTPNESIKALLVVKNIRAKPFLCFQQ